MDGLHATLRPYQTHGVRWLSFLGRLGLEACLADDMGLGKTMQILALLLREKGTGPSLLIAPASLLGNWQAEAKCFAPDLKLCVLHSSSQKKKMKEGMTFDELTGYDLVLTSYSGCTRMTWLKDMH